MDWFVKLQLLAIGFICVAYPILLFIMIWSQPTYVIISYFIWIACMLGWICIGENKRISEFVFPVLIMLLMFTCIYVSGYAVYKQSKKREQMDIWVKKLNEFYKKKIEGLIKIITMIQDAYSDEKKIERILSLLDACSGNDLQRCFGKRLMGANQELITQITEIVSKYSLTVELENKTLGEILDEMLRLKSEYKNRVYTEKQIGIDFYNAINKEHDAVCGK